MKRNTVILATLVFLLLPTFAAPALAGGGSQKTDDVGQLPDEASQFDFWIGKWSVGGATDTVKRYGSGVAILEKYSPGAGFGYSVNVFDATDKTWTQTWIGPNGNYFQVTGSKQGDDIVLVGPFRSPADGKVKTLRLTFAHITKNSFDQVYETSEDGGVTWVPLSTVPFVRIKK